jgi:hypothetical protein
MRALNKTLRRFRDRIDARMPDEGVWLALGFF